MQKKPTVISCKTKNWIWFSNKSGKSSSHGSPLGLDEIKLVRKVLKWKYKPFEIPNKLLNKWRATGSKGQLIEKKWDKLIKKQSKN